MSATVRNVEPTKITTGEEVHWTRSHSDYPATLWTLAYYFRGPGVGSTPGTGFNAAATADGDNFDIVVPAATTDDITIAGQYTWQAWVTEIADATNKVMVGSGRTKVTLGFTSADLTEDTRTAAKIMLDSIDAALLTFNTSDVQEYEITTPAGSRRVKRGDKQSLIDQRKYWASIVSNENYKEKSRNGGSFGTQIDVRFI
jgi:hypothetical protein